jgi:uncharacterized protein (DUF1501 family)
MTSRRIFLKNGGLALVSLGFAPEFLARTAAAAEARRKVLITIFQRGAVDGLNMIVPFGERAYYRARPSIAVGQPGSGPGAVLDLSGITTACWPGCTGWSTAVMSPKVRWIGWSW